MEAGSPSYHAETKMAEEKKNLTKPFLPKCLKSLPTYPNFDRHVIRNITIILFGLIRQEPWLLNIIHSQGPPLYFLTGR